MIRVSIALAAGLAAVQAQAGQDVPPPRAIRPVQPLLAAAPPPAAYGAAPGLWRDTPPVMQGWSRDRHVPVVGLDRISACAARALVGMAAADDGWLDEDADYADADADFGDDGFSPWGDM
ncbi:hypothetical protein [Sphingomonas sp. Root1294]|nr:hypothetical protein [Sphingomonas sp. Root1294]